MYARRSLRLDDVVVLRAMPLPENQFAPPTGRQPRTGCETNTGVRCQLQASQAVSGGPPAGSFSQSTSPTTLATVSLVATWTNIPTAIGSRARGNRTGHRSHCDGIPQHLLVDNYHRTLHAADLRAARYITYQVGNGCMTGERRHWTRRTKKFGGQLLRVNDDTYNYTQHCTRHTCHRPYPCDGGHTTTIFEPRRHALSDSKLPSPLLLDAVNYGWGSYTTILSAA